MNNQTLFCEWEIKQNTVRKEWNQFSANKNGHNMNLLPPSSPEVSQTSTLKHWIQHHFDLCKTNETRYDVNPIGKCSQIDLKEN